MWKLKEINTVDYLINTNSTVGENTYRFSITDFCKLWLIEVTKEELIENCKQINSWMEADDDSFLSETLSLFDLSRDDVNWDIHVEEDKLKLLLASTFGGIEFNFHLNLQLMKEEDFLETVVKPLLLVIRNLQFQKEYLKNCIKKKDVEIAEYKMDGAVLSRKNIETPPFDENAVNNLLQINEEQLNCNKIGLFFDTSTISSYNAIQDRIDCNKRKKEQKQLNSLNEVSNNIEPEIKIPKKNETSTVQCKEEVNSQSVTQTRPVLRKKTVTRKLKNL